MFLEDQTGDYGTDEIYYYYHPMRVCPSVPRALNPILVNVEVTNYPPGEVEVYGYLRAYPGIVDGCTYDIFSSPAGYSNYVDGVTEDLVPFSGPIDGGTFYYIYFQITFINYSPFTVPPIFNLTYNFSSI